MAAEQAVPESEEMATVRLEAALARIARCAEERLTAIESGPDPRLAELAARLDALIARLGSALGGPG